MLTIRRTTVFLGLTILMCSSPVHAQRGGHGGGGHGGGHVGGGFRGGGGGGFRGGSGFQGHAAPGVSAPRAAPRQVRPTVGNLNRATSITNINRSTTINNVNRMGAGWRNNYMGYHSGWVHGYWNGHYPGGFGWRPYGGYGYGLGGYGLGGYGLGGYGFGGYGLGGYGLGGYGFGGGLGTGLGLGLGWGLSSWLMGPMLYNWGYSNYNNPYYGGGYGGGNAVVAQQPVVYDYAQPIDSQAQPPDQTVSNQAISTFNSAREAFKAGDYPKALDLVNQAIKTMPNDATLHEFRALTLFALKRYDESAATLYGVLSAGPGWDWTTLISLYGDPETYTQQLRALEDYASRNSNSAAAHFVLAYHYLTAEHPDAAARELKVVSTLQPKDTLSAQLLHQLEQGQTQPSGTASIASNHTPSATPTPLPSIANNAPSANEGKLEGTWTSQPNKDITIALSLQGDGRFTWSVNRSGKEQKFAGKSSYENGILTLVQDDNNNTMVGNVNWTDPSHFTFKVMGAPQDDPGLSFSKA